MGILRRLRLLLRGRAGAALERLEDPVEALEAAYAREVASTQALRQSVADIITAQSRVRIQQEQLDLGRRRLEDLARQALLRGREDTAASALTQAELLDTQRTSLEALAGQLAQQRESLEAASQRLQARLAALRAEKETLTLQYATARARARAGELVLGLRGGDAEVRAMLDRARDRILQTQARADAMSQLMDSGSLDRDLDDLDARLTSGTVDASVRLRVDAMRRALGLAAPRASGALEAGGGRGPAADRGHGEPPAGDA